MESSAKDKLTQALEWSDNEQRAKRADRIRWISEFSQLDGMLCGRVEFISLLNETRYCFINGHFIATLMLATACIEHIVLDELLSQKVISKGDLSFVRALELASEKKLFSFELLKEAEKLRLIRNPFAHLKSDNHEHRLGNRFVIQKKHPEAVLEEDARLAIQSMYKFLREVI